MLGWLKSKKDAKDSQEIEKEETISKERLNKKILEGLDKEEIEDAKLLLACNNETILYKAFSQVKSEKLREIILEKLSIQKFLEEIALSGGYSGKLRIIAMKKANSQKVFENVGMSSNAEEIKLFALKNIEGKDDSFWRNVIISEMKENVEVIKFCVSKVQSEEILESIVKERPIVDEYYEKWCYITKKILVLNGIKDLKILEKLYYNTYFLDSLLKVEIIKRLKDEKVLMEIYDRDYARDEELEKAVLARLEEFNYEDSLAKIVVKSKDKEFISRCISKFSKKENLFQVMENAKFWYAALLAQKRLNELGF